MKVRQLPHLSATLICMAFVTTPTGYADTLYTVCAGCHGTGGVSQSTHIPTIQGLNFQYFYATMQAYRKDRRPSTIMGRIAKGFRSSQLQRMALHFGSKPWTGVQGEFDEASAQRGKALHDDYCEECHENNGHYQDRDTPPIAGQAKGYLVYQMIDYREDSDDLPRPPLMQSRLEELSGEDLAALAEFYASNPPPSSDRAPADVPSR
jgi:sulfide dehydrogenase cytochrome subunit